MHLLCGPGAVAIGPVLPADPFGVADGDAA
jgi:hypothetical protein